MRTIEVDRLLVAVAEVKDMGSKTVDAVFEIDRTIATNNLEDENFVGILRDIHIEQNSQCSNSK